MAKIGFSDGQGVVIVRETVEDIDKLIRLTINRENIESYVLNLKTIKNETIIVFLRYVAWIR